MTTPTYRDALIALKATMQCDMASMVEIRHRIHAAWEDQQAVITGLRRSMDKIDEILESDKRWEESYLYLKAREE